MLRRLARLFSTIAYARIPDDEYMRRYRDWTDQLALCDPQKAAGGNWGQVGRLQFDFLLSQGLRPHHTFLDIGCGALRGGRHFIRYLDPGHYTGFDVSANVVAAGRDLCERECLTEKRPHLYATPHGRLEFQELSGKFDFILAQGVFVHLRQAQIENCIANIARIMHAQSKFFFTFKPGSKYAIKGWKKIVYHPSFFEKLAKRYDFRFAMLAYAHPNGQQMGVLSRHATAATITEL